jgi:hypothetical protein
MHSKLTVAMLVLVGSLLGAPVVAFAQTEPAQPSATKHAIPHHKMKPSHMRTGTTTGMSTTGTSYGQGKARPGGSSVSSKPPGS